VPYYEFTVRADRELDVEALERATGLRCTRADQGARLAGHLDDGAALHGTIARLYRLGVELVALELRSSRHTA
jgi:hypothetical protein